MEQFDRITTDITRVNGDGCIRNLRLTAADALHYELGSIPFRITLISGMRSEN